MKYREHIENAIKEFKDKGGKEELNVRHPENKEEINVLLSVLLDEVTYLRELWDKLFIACAEEEAKKKVSHKEKKFLGGQDFGY